MPITRQEQLPDGVSITIRPITPDDREALAEGFERLSPRSRYQRFFAAVPRLADRELDYLTQVDHHDHEALVAIEDETGEGLAVARFVRIDGNDAEPAIAVADDWQGRGVASRLLAALADRAREEGVDRFVARMLAENHRAIRAFQGLGEISRERSGHEVALTIELREPLEGEASARQRLGAFATAVLEPARGLWEVAQRWRSPSAGYGEAIIVGIEELEISAPAIDQARELARKLGLPVQLVATYRPLLDDRRAIVAALEEAERRMRSGSVEVSTRLGRGDPALGILGAAIRLRAGLVVVGSPPPASSGGLLSSPLWSAVAHNARCSVLIARSGKRS